MPGRWNFHFFSMTIAWANYWKRKNNTIGGLIWSWKMMHVRVWKDISFYWSVEQLYFSRRSIRFRLSINFMISWFFVILHNYIWLYALQNFRRFLQGSALQASVTGASVKGLKGCKTLNKHPDPKNPVEGKEERFV